jgi:hypothetical protein
MNTMESPSQPGTKRRPSRKVLGVIQIISWILTGIFLLGLVYAVYQAVTTGDPLPVWVWIALIAVFAVIIGLVVAIVIYRAVVDQVGPFDFRAGGRVSGELVTETERIDAGPVAALRTVVDMTEGILHLSGGTDAAMEASFVFDNADWEKPLVEYIADSGNQGNLSVKQLPAKRHSMHQGRNEWILRLNDALPTDLHVKFGVGQADLVLSGLELTGLDINNGVGLTTIDLRGEWGRSLSAHIKGGIGDIKLRLPDNIGVRIDTLVNLGNVAARGFKKKDDVYINDPYGTTPVSLDIALESGIGKVTLE